MKSKIQETLINVIAEGTKLEGKLHFDHVSRVHGVLSGEISAEIGSTLILGETSLVEGNIYCDELWIDGFVKGNIVAHKKVVISGTGRVVGDIRTKSLKLEFGAYFEGRCSMEAETATLSPSPKPALST